MRVKYIGETRSFMLTNGKIYEASEDEKKWYRVTDDTGEDYLYPPELFEVVYDNIFERLRAGEKVVCPKCKKGYLMPYSTTPDSEYYFYCSNENCDYYCRFEPIIDIE